MVTKSQKPHITIFTADTGHLSIAAAIRQILDDTYQIDVNNVTGAGFALYYPFYQYFPQLFKIPFALGEKKIAQKILNTFIDRNYRLKIAEILAKQRPDAIISTWYLANPIIESYLKDIRIPFINIVTDPRTISAIVPSPKAINFVFDQQAASRCEKLHVPLQNIVVSGWFVRPEFTQPYNQKAVRRALHLNPNLPTYLIAAGSEGTNFILKIIPTFLRANVPSTVLFACGNNTYLYEALKNLDDINHRIRKNYPIRLIPLHFTNELYRYLQAANLVIGKAGPNLLFESVATLTPFFAITHISGQEDGNLEIIKTNRLGYVEENLIKANRLLNRIVKHPEELQKFTPHLKKLADYNRRAPAILRSAAGELLKQPLS
jgi:processive 1,2-diacylglycerol beta-glucosyltransferase